MLDPIDRETEKRLVDEIDVEELERHVDAFEGLDRISGTEDEWIASDYIVETLASYGIAAELLEFEGYISIPERSYIDVTVPTSRTYTEAITVSFGASTRPSGVSGEVVYLEGISEDVVAPVNVEGKVVCTRGLPTPAPVGVLEAAGAEAVVFESPAREHLHEMIVTPVWGTPGLDEVDSIPDIPVVEVTGEAGGWLREKCREGPVEATVHADVTVEVTTLPCPVASIEGTESDRYMVVGNHVDSWYEGITDNATAMAATMELARVFADEAPDRGLVFGFWPAHSTGRYAGSTWYADREWVDLRENGVAYFHLDLCGLKGAEGLWHQEMAELGDEHVDVLESASRFPLRQGDESWLGGTRPARNGDQSFWGAGLSSLLSGARLDPATDEGGPIGGGWWWHTSEDTRDKVDFDVLVEESKIAVALASRICCSPVLPHDYRETVEEYRAQLSEISETSSLEFEGIESDLVLLSESLAEAYDIIEGVTSLGSPVGRAAEDLQVALGNELIPGLYMARPDYEQEPALPHDLLPGLRATLGHRNSSRRTQLFAATDRRRAENRIRHRVRRASKAVDQFLATYG
jgi:hypothetical protein